MVKEPCHVLVVDHDRHTADNAVTLLHIWGHEAEAAYSGEHAIATARGFDADVIVMDLAMPHMNAIAEQLRGLCPGAKFVGLTGFVQADIVRRSREAGLADVLSKPTTAAELQDAVDTQCGERAELSTPA